MAAFTGKKMGLPYWRPRESLLPQLIAIAGGVTNVERFPHGYPGKAVKRAGRAAAQKARQLS